jgi:hypothetical protein
MKTNTLTIWLIAISAVSLLASCSRHSTATPTALANGTWNAETGESLGFHKDGSFSVKNLTPDKKLGGVTELDGTWTMIDSSHINVVIYNPRGNYSTIYQFSVSGDKMTISQPGVQGVKIYQRTKD